MANVVNDDEDVWPGCRLALLAVAIQRGRACRNERNHSILGVGVFWGLAAEEGSGAGCPQALRSSCPGRQDAIDEQG